MIILAVLLIPVLVGINPIRLHIGVRSYRSFHEDKLIGMLRVPLRASLFILPILAESAATLCRGIGEYTSRSAGTVADGLPSANHGHHRLCWLGEQPLLRAGFPEQIGLDQCDRFLRGWNLG